MPIPMPMRDAHGMQLPAQFDPDGKPFYIYDDGSKHYVSPQEARGMQHVAELDNTPANPNITKFLGGPEANAPGGSLMHSRGYWDDKTGTWKQDINYGNILSMGVGAALTGGALSAFMGGAAPAAAAAPAASAAAPTAATAAGTAAATTGAAASGGVLASTPVAGAGMIGAVPGAGMSGTIATTGITGAAKTMASKYLSGLIPNGGDIIKGVGGYLQGRAQSKSEAQKRADELLMNQQKREDDMRTQIANFLQGQGAQRLAATQMDPYAQAKSLNGNNVRRSFAQGWSPDKGFTGSFDMSAFDPTAMAKDNANFQSVANDTGNQQKILDYLGQNGGPNTKVCYDPKNGSQIPCAAATSGTAQGGVLPGGVR